MSSKRVAKRKGCTDKRRYGDKDSAERAMHRLLSSGKAGTGRPLNVYACRWCKGWHVGHRPMFRS